MEIVVVKISTKGGVIYVSCLEKIETEVKEFGIKYTKNGRFGIFKCSDSGSLKIGSRVEGILKFGELVDDEDDMHRMVVK